jgi:hypothetical protein
MGVKQPSQVMVLTGMGPLRPQPTSMSAMIEAMIKRFMVSLSFFEVATGTSVSGNSFVEEVSGDVGEREGFTAPLV